MTATATHARPAAAAAAHVYPTAQGSAARSEGYAYDARVYVNGLFCGAGRWCRTLAEAREWCAANCPGAAAVEHAEPCGR